jgi:hypothetical protein
MTVEITSPALELPTTAPLGAHHDGHGPSFALFSSVAEAVELCLAFGATRRIRCSTRTPARLPGMSDGTPRCTATPQTIRVDLMTRTRRRTSRGLC